MYFKYVSILRNTLSVTFLEYLSCDVFSFCDSFDIRDHDGADDKNDDDKDA